MNKSTPVENTYFSKLDMLILDIFITFEIVGEKLERRDELPRLELNLNNMKVYGNNGCNEFNGTITSVTEKKIAFSGMAMTRKMW